MPQDIPLRDVFCQYFISSDKIKKYIFQNQSRILNITYCYLFDNK